jgi:exopolysaccharide biosynthesis polyprenyl glycosylphosphotransferase
MPKAMSKTERRKGEARLQALLAAADFLALAAAVLMAYEVRFHSPLVVLFPVIHGLPPRGLYATAVLFLAAIWLPTFAALGLYRPQLRLDFRAQFGRTQSGVIAGALMSLALAFFYRGESYSRLTFALAVPLLLVLIPAFRAALVGPLARRLVPPARVAVAGSGEMARLLAARLTEARPWDRQLAGRFGADPAAMGDLEALSSSANAGDLDRVILALDTAEAERGPDLVRALAATEVEIEWVADLASLLPGRARLDQVEGLPVLVLGEFPLLGWNGFLKRVMDLTLSAAGLVVLAPFLGGIAIVVKTTSRGPVFYRQLRVGRDGRRFQMVKFRTMRLDAESDTGPVAAAREDPRVTPIGRWLRRLSLDELPQLANVLKGEMSLVGPRPERPQFIGHLATEIPNYLGRLRVKSGMTGWAQIHGLRGGESSMAERVLCDLYYIEHWSLGLDLKILFRTVFSLHRQGNAY